MDPNATVRCINEALEDDDFDAARYLARELRGWLERGGFAPTATLSEKALKQLPTTAGMLNARREAKEEHLRNDRGQRDPQQAVEIHQEGERAYVRSLRDIL